MSCELVRARSTLNAQLSSAAQRSAAQLAPGSAAAQLTRRVRVSTYHLKMVRFTWAVRIFCSLKMTSDKLDLNRGACKNGRFKGRRMQQTELFCFE